jgi:hypothetical protein
MRCCGRGMCISGWVTQNTPKRDRDLRVHEMSSAPPCPPRAHPPLHASDLACFACVLPGSRPPEGEARAPWAARPRDTSRISTKIEIPPLRAPLPETTLALHALW